MHHATDMTWCAEDDPGVRCPWAATWNVHQGTHTGQGVRNTGRGICDAGTKYMTWGHGTQGIKIQQRGPEDPFHVSAWGPSMQQQEPIFSSHKGQSVLPPPPPFLWVPKSGHIPEEWGPECPPGSHQLRQGSRPGAKSMAQEEPARPPAPVF